LPIDRLLDSNVVVALVMEANEHHQASLQLLAGANQPPFAIAAHSYAEAYGTLTRQNERAPFRFTAQEAWAALESARAVTGLVGLTAAQTFDAIRGFAQHGGAGARLYDRLIGEAAASHGITGIVTWNTRHMRSLFPSLDIKTPGEFGKR
jgi:predicted nucleic acid-binding protein